MISAVLSGWDLFWMVPVGMVVIAAVGTVRTLWRYRKAQLPPRPSWRWREAERRDAENGWMDAFAMEDVMFAVVREAKLRARAWRQANCEHVWDPDRVQCENCGVTGEELFARAAVVAGVDLGVPEPSVLLYVRCADCEHVFTRIPSAGVLCPACGSGTRIHPGVSRA